MAWPPALPFSNARRAYPRAICVNRRPKQYQCARKLGGGLVGPFFDMPASREPWEQSLTLTHFLSPDRPGFPCKSAGRGGRRAENKESPAHFAASRASGMSLSSRGFLAVADSGSGCCQSIRTRCGKCIPSRSALTSRFCLQFLSGLNLLSDLARIQTGTNLI